MTINLKSIIEQDATTLLERALLGKTLCAFGEDGLGQYGRHEYAMYFPVTAVNVEAECYDGINVTAIVSIRLDGYRADDVGHIQTDQNFEISLKDALSSQHIPREALEWMSIDDQVPFCVTFNINLAELFGWS